MSATSFMDYLDKEMKKYEELLEGLKDVPFEEKKMFVSELSTLKRISEAALSHLNYHLEQESK